MPGMLTLTAGIGGIGAELPRNLALAYWQGHLHHQDLTQCTMIVMCPRTVIQPISLRGSPGSRWEFLSTLTEYIGVPISPPHREGRSPCIQGEDKGL